MLTSLVIRSNKGPVIPFFIHTYLQIIFLIGFDLLADDYSTSNIFHQTPLNLHRKIKTEIINEKPIAQARKLDTIGFLKIHYLTASLRALPALNAGILFVCHVNKSSK